MTGPVCAECGKLAVLVSGAKIYPHRADLSTKSFWLCECGAYCGCHLDTQTPLGTPAGRELRIARMAVHAKMDPLWKNADRPKRARSELYARLAQSLAITPDECHTGMMNMEMCARALGALDILKSESQS